MKRRYAVVCLLMCVICFSSVAQNIVYFSLKDLLAQEGDTLTALNVEKRTKNQRLLTGGADYRVAVFDNETMSRRLKKRCFAVQTDKGDLYLNCHKLRYKKLYFGMWYAPAVLLGKNIYFCAVPLGSAIGANFSEETDVKLGGEIGDAIAASNLIAKRVCYELNGETKKIEFVDREKMLQLLYDYPEWKQAYLETDSPEAKYTFKYLLMLKEEEE